MHQNTTKEANIIQIDLTGKRFGILTVLCRGEPYINKNGWKQTRWLCKCDCGNERLNFTHDLKTGKAKSCGCQIPIKIAKKNLKRNTYDLNGVYGIGYTDDGKEFYFDKKDYEKIKNYCWRIDKYGYVVNQSMRMHRIICGLQEDDLRNVDHIHHNKNDNRKSELRIVTPSQNAMNKRKLKNNTSGVTGVYRDKRNGNWFSRIEVNKKRIHLGSFKNFSDAVEARRKAEEKYFGQYSYKNSN